MLKHFSGTTWTFMTLGILFSASDRLIGSNYVVFMHENGLSFFEIGIVLAVFQLTVVLLEIPTGNLADQRGRRRISTLGYIIAGSGIFLFGLAPGLGGFLLGQFMAGLGMVLVSGAFEAWYIDELKGQDREAEAKEAFSYYVGVSSLVGIGAGLVATFLIAKSSNLPFLTAGILGALTGLVGMRMMRENYGTRVRRYGDLLRDTLLFFKTSRNVVICTLAMLLFQSSFMLFILTWQTILVSNGLAESYLGLTFAALMGVTAASSFGSSFLIRHFGHHVVVILSPLFCALGFALWVISPLGALPLIFAGLFAFEIGAGLYLPSSALWRNEIIPTSLRASLLSAMQTPMALVAAFSLFWGGAIIETLNLRDFFILPAAIAAGSAGSYLWLWWNQGNRVLEGA